MSRALAVDKRRVNDTYYTPDKLAEALVEVLPLHGSGWILEPHVGGGAFARAARKHAPAGFLIAGGDVDEDCAGADNVDVFVLGDFLSNPKWSSWVPRPVWVIGNPPFRDAEAHIRHALEVSERHVVFLLRLGMLESKKRAPLWADTPLRKVWVLQQRPSFTGGGTDSAAYGWFWWDKLYAKAPSLDWVSWR